MSTTTTTTTTTTTAITTTDLFRAAYRAIRRVHPSQSRTEVLKRARKSVAKAGIRTPRGAGWVIERAVDLALRPGPKPPKTLEQRRAIARARRDQLPGPRGPAAGLPDGTRRQPRLRGLTMPTTPTTTRYTILADSHYRTWLKEVGYGYIGQVDSMFYVTPVNKGCDMSAEELLTALRAARNGP